MFSAAARGSVGSRARWRLSCPHNAATMISRALFWTCCCRSVCGTHGSTAASSNIPAFCEPAVSRRRNAAFGSNGVLYPAPYWKAKRFLSSSSSQSGDQTLSVESFAETLADAKCSSIVALVGAGASCSAGIPDFRTPRTGLYDRLGKYNLPQPESIFDLDYYTKVTPRPFVDLCGAIWPGQENGPKPTPTHHFFKLLQDKQLLRRIYTQNIDGLESLAGVSNEKLVECHGHFRSASCVSCGAPMPIADCRTTMLDQKEPPKCPSCGGLVKPDVVFFGEELPSRFQQLIDRDTKECDLLLVFGTSLLVMPVAGIPSWVSRNCPRVLFNLEPAGGIGQSMLRNRPDLFLQGDCDASVQTLCDLAGWKEDLERLVGTSD